MARSEKTLTVGSVVRIADVNTVHPRTVGLLVQVDSVDARGIWGRFPDGVVIGPFHVGELDVHESAER